MLFSYQLTLTWHCFWVNLSIFIFSLVTHSRMIFHIQNTSQVFLVGIYLRFVSKGTKLFTLALYVYNCKSRNFKLYAMLKSLKSNIVLLLLVMLSAWYFGSQFYFTLKIVYLVTQKNVNGKLVWISRMNHSELDFKLIQNVFVALCEWKAMRCVHTRLDCIERCCYCRLLWKAPLYYILKIEKYCAQPYHVSLTVYTWLEAINIYLFVQHQALFQR